MANIKSAKKRILVAQRQAMENKKIRSTVKTVIKNARVAIAEDADNKAELVRLASKKIDQAVTKGVLHKNNAARKKSSLAKKI